MESRIRRIVLAGIVATVMASPVFAQKKYDSGASDKEIVIGGISPYSGPASAYGAIGKALQAYFDKVNAEGGVNGRKIRFISYDDGYNPAKTVEMARKLVEQDEVLLVFNTLGTPPNSAIHSYMNQEKVPQLFVATGATKWGDPKHFPWTMGWQPSYQSEAKIFAANLLETKPDAKIAILYQNDDYGKDYLQGFKEGLGEKGRSQIVSELSYEVTDPTIDSQIVTLKGSGADTFFNITTPKFAAQAIKKVGETDWEVVHYVSNVSATVGSVLKPAGLDHSTGLITTQYMKDPGDQQWVNDPDMVAYKAFMKKYYPEGDPNDQLNLAAYASANAMAHVLREAGDNLTRANLMKIASNLKDVKVPGTLPGLYLNTSPTNHGPLSMLQMARFNGTQWETFGEPISATKR